MQTIRLSATAIWTVRWGIMPNKFLAKWIFIILKNTFERETDIQMKSSFDHLTTLSSLFKNWNKSVCLWWYFVDVLYNHFCVRINELVKYITDMTKRYFYYLLNVMQTMFSLNLLQNAYLVSSNKYNFLPRSISSSSQKEDVIRIQAIESPIVPSCLWWKYFNE